ncbi:MAG: hypothetical protein GF308_05890 [Candidatus Heimdallarchaeota archaeon]|nr:hypothetical protein [Candidatus Heimdallarchaeota archaeon]
MFKIVPFNPLLTTSLFGSNDSHAPRPFTITVERLTRRLAESQPTQPRRAAEVFAEHQRATVRCRPHAERVRGKTADLQQGRNTTITARLLGGAVGRDKRREPAKEPHEWEEVL